MNYEQAVEYVHSTLKFGMKLGLENMRILLSLMGDPHKKLKYIHVAGTNGKGSTVAFISNILKESGYRTGMYTSPYIERFSERIRIDNIEISNQDFVDCLQFVKSKIDIMVSSGHNHPTEFEIITAVAFYYFYLKSCDIVVLETGLGGRFDATNIIDNPEISVITSISYDHTKILGDTLEKIAFEKAGIIKNKGTVLLYSQTKAVEKVFQKVAYTNNAILIKANFNDLVINEFDENGQVFSYKNYKNIKISLLGDYQANNAIMALKVTEILRTKGFTNITNDALYMGLKNTKWEGRLELLSKKPLFFIDGAHNEDGARVLVDVLQKYFPNKNKIFIFGVLKDKEVEDILKHIYKVATCFITVTPNSDRAMDGKQLAKIVRGYHPNVFYSNSIEQGIKKAVEIATEDDLVCAFGSLYYIGEVRRFFKGQ